MHILLRLHFFQAFNGEAAQQWRTVPVEDDAGEDAVYIQNIDSGHCLRNMGYEIQLFYRTIWLHKKPKEIPN